MRCVTRFGNTEHAKEKRKIQVKQRSVNLMWFSSETLFRAKSLRTRNDFAGRTLDHQGKFIGTRT